MGIRLKKSIYVGLCAFFFTSSLVLAEPKPASNIQAEPGHEDEDVVTLVTPKEGSTVYTLPAAIKQALTISPSLESAKFDQEISEAQYQEANNARFLPQVDLKVLGGVIPDVPFGSGPEGGFPKVDTRASDIGGFLQARLEGFQPLYTFGKIKNLRKAALEGIEAKTEGIEKARNELVWQVKKAYNGLTALYSLRDFLTELQTRSGKAKDIVDKQIQKKSSEVTDIDLLRIQVFQAETERRLVEVNGGIDFALATLNVLMGLPRDSKIDIADQRLRMDDTVVQPVESYIQIAKQNRPDIKQLQNLVDIRESSIKVASSNFYPTFGIAGFYHFGWAPGREDVQNPFLVDEFNANSGGGFLVMSQNLSFHMTRSRWKQARAQYNKSISDQQRALQGIELEIRKAYTNAVAKQMAVEAAKRGFKSGRSWVLATTLNFGIGVGPPKDLIEAFVAYSTVKINYLQTLSDYNNALADLSNAIGQEVTSLKY